MTPSYSSRILLLALGFAVLGLAATPDETERAKLQFFENEVRPILAQRCYDCHGEKKQKAGLRLDHIEHILKGGEGGPALERGEVEKSMLVMAIRRKNEDLQMPPDDPLPAAEVAVLEKWVALGAPWPATEVARDAKGPRDQYGFTAEDRAYWFFRPLSNPKPPAVADSALAKWASTEIDRFVAARHEKESLQAAPAATPERWLRRTAFDLTGLPPSRGDLDVFLSD
ncbi:MAG: c-type cytochrome domain-containing protein, partial [Verrucomicrobiota bacterium]